MKYEYSSENKIYVQRLLFFSNKTVIEIRRTCPLYKKRKRFYFTSNTEPDGRLPGQASFAYFFFFGSKLSLFMFDDDVSSADAVIFGRNGTAGSVTS